ncbi:hypothetical protein N665_1274s0008 [Sinapis alba]|nr:hypothetical protein N665_1274s0008 [Sinapis alba]
MTSEVRCLCGHISKVKKAWMDDNPLRRFYSCAYPKWKYCNFFRWYDVEKSHGWKNPQELKNLTTMVKHEGCTMNLEVRAINLEVLLQMETMKTENKKEKMDRQFMIISWLVFVCVTTVIANALNFIISLLK